MIGGATNLRHGLILLLVALLLLAACGDDDDDVEDAVLPTIDLTAVSEDLVDEARTATIEEARISTGGTEPRSTGYWALWNSCAPGNRAAEAAANGGREAGWIILDDMLTDPGIGLGDHQMESCEGAVSLLEAAAPGNLTADPVRALAGQLLAAELNFNTGSESCALAVQTMAGSQIVLAQLGFNGEIATSPNQSGSVMASLPELTGLLSDYNSGQLCR